jgi:ribosomal protein L31E
MQEKKITVGIDVKGKNFKHKAKHGMTEFRRQILKHFRTNDYVISKALNEHFFAKGRANVPSKVSIIGVEKNKKFYIFLDSPEDIKNIEKLADKKVEKKIEEKPEVKKEDKLEKKVKEDKPKEKK